MRNNEVSLGAFVVLEARDLCKHYGSGETRVDALSHVDLAIAKGEMVAVMGPSGSGKSTLLTLLGAVDTPSSGMVLVDGIDLSTLDDTARTLIRRRSLGFVFQAFNLLPILSALENVSLPLELAGVPAATAGQRALASLEQVGMHPRRNHRPGMLSGGEQQRVAIARALVIEPSVVLADEPTGNLDSANGQAVTALLRNYELVAGAGLSAKGGALLDASLAENLQLKVGDQVKLLVRRGLVRTKIVGLMSPRSGTGVASGGALLMPLASAQRQFAASGKLDRIQVVLAEDAELAAVQARLQSRLPPGVQIQIPGTRSSLAEETILALEIGLQLATAFALLAAVFIVMNTFSMNVGQRRRQLAVMRAIGATRRQIGELVLREALLLGVLGTVAGLLVGSAGAYLLNDTMGGLLQTKLPPIRLQTWPALPAIAFGPGMSLLGAWLPARRAARLTPQEGMSGIEREDPEGRGWPETVVGLSLSGVSVVMFVAGFRGWIPIDYCVVATVVLLIGLVLLLPLVLRPMTWLGARLLQPAARVEVRLARCQLLRHSARTTLTVGVMFVAVATSLGLANSVVDNVSDVRNWYQAAIVGDFFVRAAAPDMETGLSAAVPETVGHEIQRIEGISDITTMRLVSATANNQRVIVVATGKRIPASPRAAPPATGTAASADSVTIGSVVAMTRVQVRKLIVAQAAMLGVLGIVPGLLAGVAMAYIMNLATMPSIGHPVAFTLSPWLLLGGVVVAMALVLLASWVPAARAARLHPATALRYE